MAGDPQGLGLTVSAGPGPTGPTSWFGVVVRVRRRHTGSVSPIGFRLHLRPATRVLRTVVLAVCLVLTVSWTVASGAELWVRAASALVALASVAGLRILWGPVVVVRAEGLRIQRNWPLRRTIRWYRMLTIDVIPGFWHLEVELNSGERLALPAVDDLDRLYRLMEQHRQALDADR